MEPRRLRGLDRADLHGVRVPVAANYRSRLLGLAFLSRRAAGAGLLMPGCRFIHSFGMRFELRVCFLGPHGEIVCEMCLRPRRLAACREAVAVLELPL